MTSLTRGPLAPGVYWRRRLAVLGTVLLLVIGVARMFGGGDEDPKATNVSASTSPSAEPTFSVVPPGLGAPDPSDDPSSTAPSAGTTPAATPGATPGATPTGPVATPTAVATPTLPAPTGRCSDDDVVVTPSVVDAQATRTVVLRLTLRTLVTPACTWHTSARSLQLKITSGSDRIWSTVDCPRAIPSRDVVVRRDTDAVVDVGWSSRRSDEDCSSHTQWAMPGYYHVTVAALGGEPHDLQFALRKPRPLVTATPTPTPTPTATATAGAREEPQGDPKRKRKPRYVD